jgi:hypothetical protein
MKADEIYRRTAGLSFQDSFLLPPEMALTACAVSHEEG